MKQPGKYHKRILCPNCKGEKKAFYSPGIGVRDEKRTCETCGGEGIVEMVWTIEYKKIK